MDRSRAGIDHPSRSVSLPGLGGTTAMPELFPFFLFLHVLGAIAGLGPTFAFPLIGGMGREEPQHANFALRLSHAISGRVVDPLGWSLGVTGLAMIWSRSLPVFEPAYRWLVLSIVLWAIAIGFATFVGRPTIRRMIELSGGAGGRPVAALASPGPGAVGAPPAELRDAGRRAKRNGLILTALTVAIVFLMVLKPSFGF
jgi:hypothetical protein